MASNPYAGIAWQDMQYTLGLQRLGHDAYYFEMTSAWPYDPIKASVVNDSTYALTYLNKVAGQFDLDGRWAYRRDYSDSEWFGMPRGRAEAILREADAVFNISGATAASTAGLGDNLILVGTDPVIEETRIANGVEDTIAHVGAHRASFTYGENIATGRSPLPAFPNLVGPTRQPVLLDYWGIPGGYPGPPSRDAFTTVANWHQDGRDVLFNGETYFWSKDREFLKFIELPRLVDAPIELATTLDEKGELEPPPEGAAPVETEESTSQLLERYGWRLADALALTTDPQPYREYVRASRAEFTVAKDANVRLRTGWFSDRSACYLAAGRPVVTQDTGFGDVLPTGRGLFAFSTMDDIVLAIESIQGDYATHSRAAQEIAAEFFRAETVLSKMLADLGL
jgi:hypothetical protein